MQCEICGKSSVFGKKVAHDRMYINKRTPRKIKPNLQTIHMEQDGVYKKRTVCTRCIRTLKKRSL
jgi:large subunit ribosomal protein L28